MSRVEQPEGVKGSLKWIQQAVNEQWPSLDQPIVEAIPAATSIEWRSPLQTDSFAEYRDGEFLDVLDLSHLRDELSAFWPARGPQWDALGLTDSGVVLLVEAKAHIAEMCSPGTQASGSSRDRIKARLNDAATAIGAKEERADWSVVFYQLANRYAHLHWLLAQGIDARLVLVNFLGDQEMGGPDCSGAWEAAYAVAHYAMGLSRRHGLAPFIIEVFPQV